MKTTNVKIEKELNDELWKHGIKNPPHHIKITAVKDKEGVVRANLFGVKTEVVEKKEKKAVPEQKVEAKPDVVQTIQQETSAEKPKKAAKKTAQETVSQ